MPTHFVKIALQNRLVFTVVTVLACLLGASSCVACLDASTITFTYSTAPGADGMLTYIDNPATTNPAHDSFFANLVSPQLGSGTVSVPNDFTNYVTGTGHSNIANFTFPGGGFSGTEDAVINLMSGSVVVTYGITSGTGAFAGAMGTITEFAHFTSNGSFSPNVPATAAITSANGTLTLAPEPGTVATLALGLLGGACLRRRTA